MGPGHSDDTRERGSRARNANERADATDGRMEKEKERVASGNRLSDDMQTDRQTDGRKAFIPIPYVSSFASTSHYLEPNSSPQMSEVRVLKMLFVLVRQVARSLALDISHYSAVITGRLGAWD